MTEIATPDEIAMARKLGACDEAIERMEAGEPVAALMDNYAAWLLQNAAAHLTPARLDWCAEQWPEVALKFAAARLTPARLDWCAEQVGERA